MAVALLAGCHATPKPAAPPSPAAAARASLTHDIDAILAQPALEHGYWGVLVKSLKNDDTLYALNARRLMLPASNMKIVTLAAAAEKLGGTTGTGRGSGRTGPWQTARSMAT